MIDPHKYQMDQANINARLNNIEGRTLNEIDRIEDMRRNLVTTNTAINNINYEVDYYKDYYKNIIADLTNRIEALEKHTLIHMKMPTHDELNEFLEGGDTH